MNFKNTLKKLMENVDVKKQHSLMIDYYNWVNKNDLHGREPFALNKYLKQKTPKLSSDEIDSMIDDLNIDPKFIYYK